jgi:hypothetical protein
MLAKSGGADCCERAGIEIRHTTSKTLKHFNSIFSDD